jgi:hypothetical protein
LAPPAPAIPGLDLAPLDALDPLDTLEEDTIADQPGEAAPHCLYCGDRLPADRPVRFCPHCGQRQAPPECPKCHSEVEPGWRHCVSCGAVLVSG